MTCDKCKWWVKQDENLRMDSEGFRTCEQPKAKIGYKWNVADIPLDGLWLENDEGWAWYTGPKFGCVNFVSKE